ncbi:MAG: 50S ribosome-binding GTPase [Bradymonadaceae bacterium]|nr:50S ribosome-binding GTPase [Lujinxingiaceae bacterium]
MRKEIIESIQRLEELLAKVPDPVAKDVRKQIEELRKLLLEQRAPRFALVGRRGSGKSSLINAIFGEPVAEVGHEKAQTGRGKWWSYERELGVIDILDTRGLQEGSSPTGEDEAVDATASILNELKEKAPDTILFLVKAKEADAAIDGDLAGLLTLSNKIKSIHGFRVPFIAIVTHCDELEPKNVRLHEPNSEDARDLEEKLARVKTIETLVDEKIREYPALKDQLITVIGVSSYQSWRPDGTVRADERWRMEELLDFLLRELPKEAQVAFARLSRVQKLQESIADKLTHAVAVICSAIAFIPIPAVDIAPITSLQVSLTSGIAYLSGRELTLKTTAEFLTAAGLNVGAGLAFREAARAIIKLVAPGVGSVVSAGVAYAATVGIGKAAAAYFIKGVGKDEIKGVFEREKANARVAGES